MADSGYYDSGYPSESSTSLIPSIGSFRHSGGHESYDGPSSSGADHKHSAPGFYTETYQQGSNSEQSMGAHSPNIESMGATPATTNDYSTFPLLSTMITSNPAMTSSAMYINTEAAAMGFTSPQYKTEKVVSAPLPQPGTVPSASPSTAVAHAIALTQRTTRRPRSEKKAIPDEAKDGKYFERRKRNNLAAKKSRDARKSREDEIAIRASFLEKENAILRAQVATLREEANSLRQLLLQKRSRP